MNEFKVKRTYQRLRLTPMLRREQGKNDAILEGPPVSEDKDYKRGYELGLELLNARKPRALTGT
jgi:hypothetical protein